MDVAELERSLNGAIIRVEYARPGMPPVLYVGRFSSVARNRFGEPVLTLRLFGRRGRHRSFNPRVGTLLSVEVQCKT